MYNKTSSCHSTYYKNSLNTSSRAKSRDLTTIICLQIIVSPVKDLYKNYTILNEKKVRELKNSNLLLYTNELLRLLP